MTNRLNVLIVEDNDKERNALVAEVNANPDKLCLAGALKSSSEALAFIRSHTTHAVILDLELQNGSGDGTDLLNKLRTTLICPRPYIVINTNNASEVTRNSRKRLGADYEFAKWQTGYTPKMVIEHLLSVMPEILGNEEDPPAPLTEQPLETRMRDFLHDEFNKLGLKVKNEGYEYLVEAVLLAANGETQNWGKIIGEKFGKKEDSVNHAMKYAIDRTWTKGDTSNLKKYYTATLYSEAPTTVEFVFYYKQKLIKHFR